MVGFSIAYLDNLWTTYSVSGKLYHEKRRIRLVSEAFLISGKHVNCDYRKQNNCDYLLNMY